MTTLISTREYTHPQGQALGLHVALLAFMLFAMGCEELVRSNACDASGTSFDVAACHTAQGVEPGGDGALCRTSADCALHFACGDGACAFFNNAPVAVADDASTTEDVAVFEVRVTDNDSDVDDDVLVVSSVSQGRNGIVTIGEFGDTVLYRPLPDTNGIDAFTYSIDDGNGGTRTASVTVDVVPENDAPELRTTSVAVNEDSTITVQLELRDPDGDVVTVDPALAVSPQRGVAVIANNALSYTPFPDYFGPDSIVVGVDDGTTVVNTPINIDVFSQNDAPVAALLGGGTVVDVSGTGALEAFFDASASFDDDVDDQPLLQFTWFVDGADTGVTGAAPVVPLTVGRHTVTVVVTDPFGAASSAEAVTDVLPTRLFVDANAPGDGTGFSWERASRTLDAALALAPNFPGVREIFVADGIYRAPGPNGFALVADVAVLGGFAGGETFIGERDIDENVAILSGDTFGDDGPGFANRGDNVFHVVSVVDVPGSPTLDGFTISGGFARPEIFADSDHGAAILVRASSPSLLRLRITDNVAVGVPPPADSPDLETASVGTVGGIVVAIDSNMAFAFSSLVGNVANVDVGGGIGALGGAPFFLNVMVIGMTSIDGLDAARLGGGAGFFQSSPNLFGCLFLGNRASRGGAIAGVQSTVSARFDTFVDNQGTVAAGAVDGIFFAQSSIFVNNTVGGLEDIGAADDVLLDSCVTAVVFANDTAGADGVPRTDDDDYTLAPSSCGFDTGVAGLFVDVNRDLLDRPRIAGAAPDMGGYEAP